MKSTARLKYLFGSVVQATICHKVTKFRVSCTSCIIFQDLDDFHVHSTTIVLLESKTCVWKTVFKEYLLLDKEKQFKEHLTSKHGINLGKKQTRLVVLNLLLSGSPFTDPKTIVDPMIFQLFWGHSKILFGHCLERNAAIFTWSDGHRAVVPNLFRLAAPYKTEI